MIHLKLYEGLSLWTRSLLKLETKIKIDIPINPQFVKSRNKVFLLFMWHLKEKGYDPIIIGSENWQGALEGKSTYSHLNLFGNVTLDDIFNCFPVLEIVGPKRKPRRDVTFYIPKTPDIWNDTNWGIIYLYDGKLWRCAPGDESRSDNAWRSYE